MADSREYGNDPSGTTEKGTFWADNLPLTYEKRFNCHVGPVCAFKLCSNQHSDNENILFKDYISVFVQQIFSLLYHIRIFLQRGSQIFWCNTIQEWHIRSYALYVMCLPKSKFFTCVRVEISRAICFSIPKSLPLSQFLVQAVRLYRHREEIYETRNNSMWSQGEVMCYIRQTKNYKRSVVVNENVGVTSVEQPKLRNLVLFT